MYSAVDNCVQNIVSDSLLPSAAASAALFKDNDVALCYVVALFVSNSRFDKKKIFCSKPLLWLCCFVPSSYCGLVALFEGNAVALLFVPSL